MEKKPYNIVLFDLDGTLIDEFRAIYRCFQYTFKQLGLPCPDFQTIKNSVGLSLPTTLKNFFKESDIPSAINHFRDHYETIRFEDLNILDGALWILKSLQERGYRTALYTNKNTQNARLQCDFCGFTPYLERIFAYGDTPYHKPQREFSEHVLSEMKSAAHEACLVGDSIHDLDTGFAIGMHVYAMPTGTHSEEQLTAHSSPANGIYKNLYGVGQGVFGFKQDPLTQPTHA